MWPEILCGWSVKPLAAPALWQLASQHQAWDFVFQKMRNRVVLAANVLSVSPVCCAAWQHQADESGNINKLKVVPFEISCAQKVITVVLTFRPAPLEYKGMIQLKIPIFLLRGWDNWLVSEWNERIAEPN